MVKSEHSCPNLGNYFMWLTMLIITGAQPLLRHPMGPESFQEAPKVKSGFGRFPSKPKSWRLRWKSTEAEYGQFKLTKTTLKQCQQVVTGHALFGISRLTQEFCVFSSQQLSSRLFWTLKSIKSWRQDLTEKSHIGKNMMVLSSDQLRDLTRNLILSTWQQRASISCQVARMESWEFTIMTRAFATSRVKDILAVSTR